MKVGDVVLVYAGPPDAPNAHPKFEATIVAKGVKSNHGNEWVTIQTQDGRKSLECVLNLKVKHKLQLM